MSPGVTNFVHDLVAMAQAMDELPRVKDALAEAEAKAEEYRQTLQRREEKIISLHAEIDTLVTAKNKEADRADDAELRFLELEEKLDGLTKLIRSAASAVGMVDKPEPVVVTQSETEAQQQAWEAQYSSMLPAAMTSPTREELIQHEFQPMPAGDMAQPQGQSEQSLTAFMHEYDNVSHSPDHNASSEGSHNPLPHSATTAAPSPDASQPAPSMGSASDGGGSEGKYASANWSELSSTVQDEFWHGLTAERRKGRSLGAKSYWIENGGSDYSWGH